MGFIDGGWLSNGESVRRIEGSKLGRSMGLLGKADDGTELTADGG